VRALKKKARKEAVTGNGASQKKKNGEKLARFKGRKRPGNQP